jgi:hypothetical protein
MIAYRIKQKNRLLHGTERVRFASFDTYEQEPSEMGGEQDGYDKQREAPEQRIKWSSHTAWQSMELR